MKILMVNKFFRIVGGSDTYCFALAEALTNAGHEVIFFSMKDEKNRYYEHDEDFVNNVDYYTSNPFKKVKYAVKYIYSYEAKKKIAEVLDREKPDIVHLNHIHHQITLSIVSEIKKRNIPMVFVLHDVICACPNYMMLSGGKICEDCVGGHYLNCIKKKCVQNSFIRSCLAALESWNWDRMGVYNDIDLYIAPSEFYKRKLTEAGFTNKPIVHLRNMLPGSTNYCVHSERENYTLFFGRLSKEKGIMTLIKAFERLESDRELYIVGEGDIREEIDKYISVHNLQNRVFCLGYKSGDELNNIVEKAKCVVLASEWYENGPYAIAEAMSKGTPCIVSNIGGLPEIVDDGITGYISEAGNVESLAEKLEDVYALSDEDYGNMCKAASDKAAQLFSEKQYTEKIIKIYRTLLNERGITQ